MTQGLPPPIDTTHTTYTERCIEVLKGQPHLDVDAYQTLKNLDLTKRVVRVIGQSSDTLFEVQARTQRGLALARIKPTTLGQGLLDLILHAGVHRYTEMYPGTLFTYEVELLRAVLTRHSMMHLTSVDMDWNTLEYMMAIRDRWNRVVQDLRAAIQAPEYVQQQQKNTRASAKNLRSVQRWFSHICAHHARLLVLRIDLYYPETSVLNSGSPHAVDLDEIFEHRNQFLRGLPRWIDNSALLGYLCKTEYQIKRNIHHHLLILVDGSKLCRDIQLVDALGLRWRKLTMNRGTFFNVNMLHKRQPDTCCIGDVDVRDEQKVSMLRGKVIPYLSKPDFLIRWVVPKKYRLLLKSVSKPLTGNKPGRPRNVAPTTDKRDTTVAQGV